MAAFLDVRLPDRFWSKAIPDPMGGCWLWIGAQLSDGYGQIQQDGKRIRSHRAAYEALVGPIPAGLDLDHLCRVRCCVNPAHLEPVTERENTLRGIGVTAMNAIKTTCSRGHQLPETFNYTRPRYGRTVSERRCAQSHRDAERERGRRNRQQANQGGDR